MQNAQLLPHFVDAAVLAASPHGTGRASTISDGATGGLFVWDAACTTSDFNLDPYGVNIIPANASVNGAWVSVYGDPRMGSWANSTPPACFGRFRAGLRIGDAATAFGA